VEAGLPEELRERCELSLDLKIHNIKTIYGGDINEARLLETDDGLFFIKYNSSPFALKMLLAENYGLDKLRFSKAIKIPKVVQRGKVGNIAYLILEYIEPYNPSIKAFENLGEQLAQLHKTTQSQFGLDYPNFIGTLPQSNNFNKTWDQFFIQERLQPQIQLAKEKTLLTSSILNEFDNLFLKIKNICPEESPALIHGDLWKGNFLITKNHCPVLIDPSVAYSHREMDLAMTKLFGGFDSSFYNAYQNIFPLAPNFEERVEVYQLYYLLVHLNLFGTSYLLSIQNILKKFV